MINIPNGFERFLSKDFVSFVNMFNNLEQALEYPHCEGYADQERKLKQAETVFNSLQRK